VDNLTIPLADDLHVHLRQGELMNMVVPLLRAGGVGRCLVMPNTRPPVVTPDDALHYKARLQQLAPDVEFLMTLYLTPNLTPANVKRAADAGIAAVKCYPRGVTTNAGDGVEDFCLYDKTFAAMAKTGLVLSLHGEMPVSPGRGIDVFNAEQHFLPELERLHNRFPKLKIVFEHVSTSEGVACVEGLGAGVAATITPHHLDLISDDWKHNIHNYCKPVPKLSCDRAALWGVIKAGHPRFFLGSDSAPHTREAKESGAGCAGIFTTPLLLPYLADSFDRMDCLDRLSSFVSGFGRDFYELPGMDDTVTLQRHPQTVPSTYGAVVPYRAGEQCNWSAQATGSALKNQLCGK